MKNKKPKLFVGDVYETESKTKLVLIKPNRWIAEWQLIDREFGAVLGHPYTEAAMLKFIKKNKLVLTKDLATVRIEKFYSDYP